MPTKKVVKNAIVAAIASVKRREAITVEIRGYAVTVRARKLSFSHIPSRKYGVY